MQAAAEPIDLDTVALREALNEARRDDAALTLAELERGVVGLQQALRAQKAWEVAQARLRAAIEPPLPRWRHPSEAAVQMRMDVTELAAAIEAAAAAGVEAAELRAVRTQGSNATVTYRDSSLPLPTVTQHPGAEAAQGRTGFAGAAGRGGGGFLG